MERAPNSKLKSNPSSDFEVICFKLNPIFKVENLHLTIHWIKTSGTPGQTWPLFFLENIPILLLCITSKYKKKERQYLISSYHCHSELTGYYVWEENCITHDWKISIDPFPHTTTLLKWKHFKIFFKMDIFCSHFQSFSVVFPQTMSLKM